MTDLRKAAEMALEALQHANDVCLYERCEEDFYTDEINALRQALAEEALDRMVAENQKLGLYDDAAPEVTPEVTPEVPCKTDPRAPHGFNRNASFDEDRYVCDCEFWEPDVDNSAHEAEDVHGNVDNVNMSEERVHKSDKSINEPVAIVNAGMGGIEWLTEQLPDDTPLYAAPPKQEYQYEVVAEHADGTYTTKRIPKRQWFGLTADEIWKCNKAQTGSAVEFHICSAHQNVMDFAEAIEAKLKEKNNG